MILSQNIRKQIAKDSGNQYIVGDIHACFKTFKALIKRINLQKNDQLFLLGDYIDRGTDAKATVDYIFELQKSGFQVFPLMGNHEEMLLNSSSKIVKDNVVYSLKTDKSKLYNEHNEIDRKYFDFISQLPYFIELENAFLVHAGFDFDIDEPFSFVSAMLWIRGWKYNYEKAKGKFVIFGHTPTQLSEIKASIENGKKAIPLDNGCVFKGRQKDGFSNLLCLNLTNFELIIQQNIDFDDIVYSNNYF